VGLAALPGRIRPIAALAGVFIVASFVLVIVGSFDMRQVAVEREGLPRPIRWVMDRIFPVPTLTCVAGDPMPTPPAPNAPAVVEQQHDD
jgi:hypothetical protein